MKRAIMCLFGAIILTLSPVETEAVNNVDFDHYGNKEVLYPQELTSFLALAADFFSGMFDIEELNDPDAIITDAMKEQIDQQIEHYLHIVKKAHGLLDTGDNDNKRRRRDLQHRQPYHLTNDYPEMYILKGFKDAFTVPSRFPSDICLFQLKAHNSQIKSAEWFAAALEMETYVSSYRARQLVVYKLQGDTFMETYRTGVSNARRLETFDVDGNTFLVAAEYPIENTDKYLSDLETTMIYQVTSDGGLMHVQSLQRGYHSDVAFWKDLAGIHLVIANEYTNTSGSYSVATNTPIYRWLGGHFDVLCYIPTYNPKRIIHFTIGSCSYLAVANHQNNFGETAIFSEVFKYNVHLDAFVSYQKLATRAATDIKYFCVKAAHGEDHFLIVANQFERDIEGAVDYRTSSTVYKFSEDYFVPFQSFILFGATEWLPLHGPNGEFILLVNCINEGIKAFQYDGWMFLESPTQFGGAALGRGVLSMRSYIFQNNPILVVANKFNYGDNINVFNPVFTMVNEVSSAQNELLEWCETSIQEIHQNNIGGIMEEVSKAPKITSKEVFVNGKLEFLNVDVKHVNTSVIRSEGVVIDNTNVQNINSLDSGIIKQSEIIEKLEKQVGQLVKSSKEEHYAEIAKGKNEADKESIDQEKGQTKSNKSSEEIISEETLDDKSYDKIEINELIISGTLRTNTVNGHDVADLVYTNRNVSLSHLNVNGTLHIVNELIVDGQINNVNFNSQNILLNNGDQFLDGDLKINNINIEKLSTEMINNEEFPKKEPLKHNYTVMEVDNLQVNLVNGLHFNVISDNALRTQGDQIITAACVMEDVVADELMSENISNVEFASIVKITGGTYAINHTILFLSPLYVRHLIVESRISNILIVEGKLQILKKNITRVQFINATKFFENINLLGPLALSGKVNSTSLDLKNPVNMIERDLELYGDFVLTGNTTIRHSMHAAELSLGNKSVSTLQRHGLKLDESFIYNNIEFQKSFLTSKLSCPQINSVNTSSWVSSNSNIHQTISGPKQFNGNLDIDGPCTVIGSINKINVNDLDTDILKISGDQVLEGKIYFENVHAEKAFSNKTVIGGVPFEQFLLKSDGHEISGDVVVEDTVTVHKHLSAEVVLQENSAGTVGFIQDMFYDTALNDGKQYNITGEKYFNNLTIHSLYINGLLGGLDFGAIMNNMVHRSNSSLHFKESMTFSNNVTINELVFEGSLDSISHEEFGVGWLLLENDQTIDSSIEFLNVKCYEPLEVYSGFVNTKNLSTLNEAIVWTNREEQLRNVKFVDGVISVMPVIASTVSGKNFSEEIVLNEQAEMQIISDTKHLRNLKVHGLLTMPDTIGNISLQRLKEFAVHDPTERPPSVIVKGSVKFEVEPVINFLNGYNVTEVLSSVWLSNEDTVVSGSMRFANLYLNKEVVVNGLVNGVDLRWISDNCFSLARDQNISSSFEFFGGVKFNSNVISEGANVDGLISGLKLKEFVANRLNDKTDQVITGEFMFEDIIVSGDHNSGTVNSHNFSTSFLRYDVTENYVTGDKVFDEVTVNNILVDPMHRIQDVEINQWFKHAVFQNGDFIVRGLKTMQDPTLLSDLSFSGSIDGVTIALDTVLLKYGDQTITGKKTFSTKPTALRNFTASFTNLYIHGQLSKVHVNHFLNELCLKGDNIILQTPVTFTEMLYVEDKTEVDGLLYGVNVTILDMAVDTAENFNNYEIEYKDLYSKSQIITESLKSPAFYLSHYEVIQNIEGSSVICPLNSERNALSNNTAILAKMDRKNNLSFMTWSNEDEEFIDYPKDKQRMAGSHIDHISGIHSITFQGKTHLYVETIMEPQKARTTRSENYTYEATIYEAASSEMTDTITGSSVIPKHKLTYSRSRESRASGQQTVLSFNVYERQCLFVMDSLESMVYCTNETESNFLKEQMLKTQGAVMAVSLNIQQVPHIMVLIDDNKHSAVIIYKCGQETFITLHGVMKSIRCDPKQVLHTKNPRGLSAVTHEGHHYLVTSTGYGQNAMHHGKLLIYRYDSNNKFTLWQPIIATAPSVVAFSVLPTRELVLYVLSESRTETFNVYIYKGVAGFVKLFTTSTIPRGVGLTTISLHYRHFVMISTENNIAVVVEANIKGEA